MWRSFCTLFIVGIIQAGDWSIDLNISPNPSPYLSDWQSHPGTATLTITYTGTGPAQVQLSGSISRNGTVIAQGTSEVLSFSGPETRIISNEQMVTWTDVSYSTTLEEQIVRSGRFPEGTYTFCIRLLSYPDGNELAGDCESYTIVLPRPPTLLTPANNDTVNLPFPVFTWTPLTAPPTYTIHYRISIWEMIQGQTPDQAASGFPIFVDTVDFTMFTYPVDAPELEDGHSYVWQVQSLDSIYQPFGENQGRSDIFAFTYSPVVGPPSRLGDTLTIIEDAAYLVISGLNIEETPTSYILSGNASLLLPVLTGVPPITVGVSNLEVSKNDLSIVGGSFNAPSLDPSIFPQVITGAFLRITGLGFDASSGFSFTGEFHLPDNLGIPDFSIPGSLTLDRHGLHGTLSKTAPEGSSLFSLGSGMLGLDITGVELHFSAPVVSLQGKLHVFDTTLNFRIDTLSLDGTDITGKLKVNGPLTLPLVPGSDLVTIRMDSIRGNFSTGGSSLNLYGGFGMRLSSGTCGGDLVLNLTNTGISLNSFHADCDSLLSDLDLGWVHINFRNLDLASLSYSQENGWDFNLNLDVRFSFPYLDSLRLPWLSGISLGTDGFHFPDIDLSNLNLPAFNFGGFGLRPLGFRMADFTFPWFNWSEGMPTGFNFSFDFEFTMPHLPESFPECIRLPDIRVNDVSFSEGRLSFDLPLKVINPPGCRIPLGDSVFFNILQLTGSFSAQFEGGNFDVNGGVDVSGNLSLPSIMVCESGSGQIDLTSFTLHFDSEGHLSGSVENIIPSCPIRFGPFQIRITRSDIDFRVSGGEQEVVFALDGTLRLPSPTPGDTIEASGNLVLELVHFRLIDGSIRITEPFVWNIPSESPVLAIRVDSARIDTAGFHIDGSGNLLLAEGYSVGVNFNHLVLDLRDFNVKSGSANFTSSFAFRIDMSGGGMVWSAVQAGAQLLGQGILLNLPENISLRQGGIAIRDTSEVQIIWNQTTYTVRAVFSDSFLLSWVPDFGVSAGRVDFYLNDRRVAWLDSHGFHPEFTGIIPIPAKLPIPDTTIAYIKLKENDSLLIHFSYVGDTLRLYTEEGHPVYIYVPALRMGDFVPNFGVEFDVKVNPTSFEFLDGDIHARPPEGIDTLFTLTRLGIPLGIRGFDYINQNGTYGILISGSFVLPSILDSLEIVFDSLTITNEGLSGTARVGEVYDTLTPGATFIDSIVLGNFITFRVNGAEISFSPLNARFSGDIVPGFFEDQNGSRFPIHFVASVGTEGLDFNFDYPDSLPISLANFALQELEGHPPLDITVGDTLALELSGVLSLPFLGDSFQLSITGLKIMSVTPYVVCPDISYPSPEQFFRLFGTTFGLMDIVKNGTTYHALSFGYRDGAFSIKMSGMFEFLGDTITFTNLTVDTKGNFSFDYVNLLSHPDTLIDPYWIVDTVMITMDSLKVAGSVNLPPPFDETGAQRYSFTVGFDGSIRGGANVKLIDETPGLGGNDRSEFDFFIGTMDINYLALNIDLSDLDNCGVAAIFYFYFDENRVIKFGNKDGRNISPGLTIHFNGDFEWGDLDIPQGSIPDIDWEVFRMNITDVSASGSGGFELCLSGSLSLNISTVEGGIDFSDFRVRTDGHVDFPRITGANLTIANMMDLSITEINYFQLDHDTTIQVPTVTLPTHSDSGSQGTRPITLRSYFSFGLTLTLNIGGAGGGGGVDQFVAYRKSDGTPGFVVKDAHFAVPQVFDAHLNMEFEGGEDYRFLFVGQANMPAANNTEVLVIGKLAHTDAGPSFGAFISVSTEIDIIPRLVILSSVGGGFFYNPEPEDIELVRSKAGLTGPPFDTISVQPARFGILFYAGVRVVSEWAAEGRALVTITDREFTLSAKVVVLHMQDKITGYAYLGVGFQDFYAVGLMGIKVDIASLISGQSDISIYVYDEDAWGIMGDIDIKLFRFIDLESSLFVGPPGFMLENRARFGFDIWLISISAGFEGDIWYVRSVSWGAYFKAYVSAEIFGGLAAARGWLEACLLGEPRFYLYGVAGVEVSVIGISKSASVWAKISSDGIDGGFGRDPEMEDLIEQARNTAEEMEEAKQEVQDAIASAQVAVLMLSPEEQARVFYSVFTSEFRYRGSPLYQALLDVEETRGGLEGLEIVPIQFVANRIYSGQNSPYGDTTEIVLARMRLQNYINRIDRLRGRVNMLISSLNVIVDSVQQAGLTGLGESPVNDKRIHMDALQVTISGGRAQVNSTPTFSIDENTLNQNTMRARQYEEQVRETYMQVMTRINQIEDALQRIESILSEEVMDTLLKSYTLAEFENSRYFSELVNYIKRFRRWVEGHRSWLESRHSSIRYAVLSKTTRISNNRTQATHTLKSLVRRRKLLEYSILYHRDIVARDSAYNEFISQTRSFTPEQWIEMCDSTGMELWYNIPYNGLAYMDSIFQAYYDTVLTLYDESIDSIERPHEAITEALDRVYEVTRMLGEVLYDLYDRMIVWLEGVSSDTTVAPPMTGNQAVVRFPNGGQIVLTRLPGPGGTIYYQALINLYMQKIDSLAYLVTPPHIRGIAVETANRGFMAPTIFYWNYSHPGGIDAIRDISYKIVPASRSPYLFSFRSTGKREILTGNQENFYSYYFFQRRDEASQTYRFYLRVRTALGYSQTKCVPFTVYYDTAGGGMGSSHSYAVPVDTTPPVITSLDFPRYRRKVVGPHRVSPEFYTSSTSELYAEWNGVDPESDIEEYELMLERIYSVFNYDPVTRMAYRITLSDTLVPWRSVHGLTRYTLRSISLQHNQTYRLSVRARNGAGLTGRPLSRLVRIDTTPPPPPSPYTGFYIPPPLHFVGTPVPPRIHLKFTVNQDPESQVKYLFYKVDTVPHRFYDGEGWDTLRPSENLINIVGNPVHYLDTFYISIVSENIVGLISDSAYVSPPLVPHDPTPPERFSFEPRDNFYENRFLRATDSITIRFIRLSNDPETGLKRYLFGVGRSGNGPDITDYYESISPEDVGSSGIVSLKFDTSAVRDGERIFLFVMAENNEGQTTTSAYGPLILDKSPPPEPEIYSVEYNHNTLRLRFRYSDDPQSGILNVGYMITDSRGRPVGDFQRIPGVSPGDNSVVVRTSSLAPGVYKFKLVVTNRVHLKSEASCNLEVRR